MREILRALDVFFAGDDSWDWKNPDLATIPIQCDGFSVFFVEGLQPIDTIKKIHQCVVGERHYGSGEDLGAEFFGDIERLHILPLR